MPCFHPLTAWRHHDTVTIGKQRQDGDALLLPCGNCLGCRTNRAQAWALRCQLEMQQHEHAVFATYTYDEEHKPLTLSKQHLSAYLKQLRKRIPNKLRFFASGEYGENTQRPHYHAIIYGASELQAPELEETWQQGNVKIDPATPANIAYTAGYCSKKIGYRRIPHERVDPTTGEVYQWQPPFILMSRRPGIGSHARQFINSWRLYAVKDGHKMPVPRYYKEAWKTLATLQDTEKLAEEIRQLNLKPLTKDQLRAAEQIAEAQHKLKGEKRNV